MDYTAGLNTVTYTYIKGFSYSLTSLLSPPPSPSPQKRVNREFETMFETGVDEMSWDDTVSDNVMMFL
jgi:hypothetical protein